MISDQERSHIFEAILAETEAIRLNPAVQLALPEIKDRFYFTNSMALLSPRGGPNFQAFRRLARNGGSPTDLKIYLVHPDDPPSDYVGAAWQGNYSDEYYIVALQLRYNETPRRMACWLIHEFGHVFRSVMEGRMGKKCTVSREKRLAEEVDMYTFDYKLPLAIGDAHYKAHAEEVASQLFQWRMGQQKDPPPDTGFAAALDSCFGSVKAPVAQEHRKICFKTYCDMMAAERYPSPEAAYQHKREVVAYQIFDT